MSSNTSLQKYLNHPEKRRELYRRTLAIIVISQIIGGAGLAAGITVGALLAEDMLGTGSLAGIPTALFTLGSAGAALFVGRLSQRFGRRFGLVAGFLTAGLGAIGVVVAAVTSSIVLLLASLFLYGAGTATNLQARYAGADLAGSTQRATAVSIAMVSTTFGAVAGPNLVGVMGEFAVTLGVPALAGSFILAAAAFILAGLIPLVWLRPDPLIVANAIAAARKAESEEHEATDHTRTVTGKRGLVVGATIMALTQTVMVAIMTMTPVYMKSHGYGLSDIGLVIGVHVGALYLPSLVTGVLADKLGRTVMAVASGVTLLAAGVVGAIAPPGSIPLLITALALLGLGWNFGLISGTALIVDATDPSVRAKTQGSVDVFIALSGASGGVLSGAIMAQSSYAALSLAGGALSLVLVPVMIWFRSR